MRNALSLLLLISLASCSVNKNIPEQFTMPEKKEVIKQFSFEDELKQWNKAPNSVLILVPMSGENAIVGQSIVNACLAAASGVKNIDFYVVDTQEGDMAKLYEKFKFHHFNAIIGPVFYNEVNNYEALFRNSPIFSLSNNTAINNQHVVACGLSPQEEIHKISSYIKKNKMNGILLIMPENSYADRITHFIKKAFAKGNTEQDIDIIKYTSISTEDATRAATSSGRKAIFVLDPILDINKLKNKMVFTLSSSALSNREAWEGVVFAFSSNNNRRALINYYKKFFKAMPTTIDLVAFDIAHAVVESTKKSVPLFDTKFSGCLGDFFITKKNGIVRNLNLYKMQDSAEVDLDSIDLEE